MAIEYQSKMHKDKKYKSSKMCILLSEIFSPQELSQNSGSHRLAGAHVTHSCAQSTIYQHSWA